MNTELRKLARNDFEKDLFKLMNNSVFGKTMENIRKLRDIKLVTTDNKRSKLVSEPNYHTINLISEDLSIIEMKKTKVKMNKPIYLGLSILEISKILMYEFWYDYMKPKYNDNVKLCYTDNDKIDKKAKGTKKCVIKKMIKFDDYKKCLLNDKVILKSQQRFISNKHDEYTEDVNKIALSNDDDKRIVSPDKISSYPYRYTF